MKKINIKGFVLAETLIVTTVVAGFLIYIFVQLSNLGSSYNRSLKYNSVEGLYALDDIIYVLDSSSEFKAYVTLDVSSDNIVEISEIDCTSIDTSTPSGLEMSNACLRFKSIIEYEYIENLYISYNDISSLDLSSIEDIELKNFILSSKTNEDLEYRVIARFRDNYFATVGW